MIGVSAGTANALGLKKIKCGVNPTTAYFLIGDRCTRDCSFCSLSRSRSSNRQFLSRVTWPLFPVDQVINRLAEVGDQGNIGRVCLQVVHHPAAWERGKDLLKEIKRSCDFPVSVSCTASRLQDIQSWFDAGAQRFALALDAASERIFKVYKGAHWQDTLSLLYLAAEKWPGRISTHLIAGLGETDAEFINRMHYMIKKGILVGLFAFTPVRGARCESLQPPPLYRYRRLQAAHYLMKEHGYSIDTFNFDGNDNLTGIDLPGEKLVPLLAGGEAFMTSGCDMCNRPYYNEKPGGEIYNYPRKLSQKEVYDALQVIGFCGNVALENYGSMTCKRG